MADKKKFGGKLFDRYDDTVKVSGSRKDFPTCTVAAVCDKVTSEETDDGTDYLKAHFTVLWVERGDETDQGRQHTIPFFKRAKTKFFERDTKDLARAILGMDREQGNALKTGQVLKTLETLASGTVLRIRATQKTQEAKAKDKDGNTKTVTFTNIEYLDRLGEADVLEGLGDKKLLKQFFPQGFDDTDRGIGFGEESEEELEAEAEPEAEDEPAPPRKPAAKAPAGKKAPAPPADD